MNNGAIQSPASFWSSSFSWSNWRVIRKKYINYQSDEHSIQLYGHLIGLVIRENKY